jgi:hypothetical protein
MLLKIRLSRCTLTGKLPLVLLRAPAFPLHSPKLRAAADALHVAQQPRLMSQRTSRLANELEIFLSD